jgi:hypothetical protein
LRPNRLPGNLTTIACNDGSIHPVNTPFDEPFSFQICELFKVRNGKLLRIEALVTPVRLACRMAGAESPVIKNYRQAEFTGNSV